MLVFLRLLAMTSHQHEKEAPLNPTAAFLECRRFHSGLFAFSKVVHHCHLDFKCLMICLIVYLFVREGDGTPLQYSGLENPMEGGA